MLLQKVISKKSKKVIIFIEKYRIRQAKNDTFIEEVRYEI
jgi:hypothetical protein